MSYTMSAPEVQSSVTGKIPQGIYTVRATKTAERTDRAPKGYMRTIIACEIVAPDIAVDESSPDKTKYSVAGRKFRLYLPIDPVFKQYSDSYSAFDRLGYKKPDGSIDLDKFWDDADVGTLFFIVALKSSEDVVKDGAGRPWVNPATGQPLSRGWNIDFVQPNDVLGRAETGTPNPAVGAGLPY